MDCAIGTFLVANTDTVGTTFTVSGLSFTPTVFILFAHGGTGTTDTALGLSFKRSLGVAVSPTKRWAVTSRSVDAADPSDTAQAQTDTSCLVEVSTANAIEARLDLQSMEADGAVFVVDDQFATSTRVRWKALNPTNVDTFTLTEPAATGTVDVTSLAFQPEFAFFGHAPTATAAEAAAADSRMMIGAACSSSQMGVWAGGANDSSATTATRSYCTDDECIAVLDAAITALVTRATFDSFLSNGLRVNFTERSALRVFHGLAMAGNGQYAVGGGLTQTDTTTPITMPGSAAIDTVTGGIVISHCKAESTADTPQTDDEWSMGAFASATDRLAIATLDEDSTPQTQSAVASEFDAVYANLSTADALEGVMDVNSMAGKTYIMDDADPSAAFFFNILFGTADAPPGGGSFGGGPLLAWQRTSLVRTAG